MGKKKGKKKGGPSGEEAAEQQPSTSSAPPPAVAAAPAPVVEQPPAEGGKKRGKGVKPTQSEEQPTTATAPQPSVPPMPYAVPQPSVAPARFALPQTSMPPARFATAKPTSAQVAFVGPELTTAQAPFAVTQRSAAPVPQPEVYCATGEATEGARKKRGKGGKVTPAAQVEQPPAAEKPGPSQPPGQRPPPDAEAPVSQPPGMEAWPSLGGGPPGFKGRQKRAQGPAPQVQSAPPGMQRPPPGLEARPQPAHRPSTAPEAPRVSPPQEQIPSEPRPPGSRRGTQAPRVAPPGRGARLQPVERPSPGRESPRVSSPQEQPPSEPQPPGPRGPPPGMGPRSQPAQRSSVPQAQPPPQPGAGRPTPVQQLTTDMSKLSLQIPPRRKTGTAGKRIRVATNMLALNLNNLKSDVAIHYDVTFDPDRPKRLLFRAMEAFRKRFYPDRFPAFDGRKNLYSCGPLPFGDSISGEVSVKDSESTQDKPFKITVKFASEVDLQSLRTYMRSGSSLQAPQTALQAIDVVLRHAASFSFVKVGRSFFSPPRGTVIDLGDGHEMWYGVFQSAILGWRPFINVDVAHKGFPKAINCVELLGDLFRSPTIPTQLRPYQLDDLKRYMKGLKVEYELPNQPATRRTYRVNDLDRPASDLRFNLDDGRQVTVQQYFEREKRQPLRYPHLPCLWVGSRTRENKIFLPLEFCKIVQGQVVQKKMTELQTSNMIKKAATSTDVRKQKIMDALRTIKLSENETVNGFGLTVSDRFEEIDARILNPPALDYGLKDNPQTVYPSRGVWRPSKFREGSKLTNWAILSLNSQTREDELRRLGRELTNMGHEVGMTMSECGSYRSIAPPFRDTRELEQYLREQKSKKVELVVVVIPERDVYAKVKQLAEIKVGILTQCIKGKTLFRLNGSTVSNILLKLNSKLNGVNHCLAPRSRPNCLKRPIMIVGADVTHPSPDQTTIPSVAAVSASHDPTAFQYNMEYRLQPARVEIIQDLENIMRKQLRYFNHRTGYQPERIIFYRDGVSEGQFLQVLNAELMAIRRACTSLHADYKPKITFLVVQKRHHTRFFPLRDQDADGKNRNVPPGTVVDTDITHPTELDFYLVSHASIQGVSRPTKYHRLWDDSDMDEDELENLTYYLCHLFTRCARSVSYPAPTYYAHLAAYRARVYLEGKHIQLGNLDNEQKLSQTDENFVKNNPMYFV